MTGGTTKEIFLTYLAGYAGQGGSILNILKEGICNKS
jgi:hypothetical protein